MAVIEYLEPLPVVSGDSRLTNWWICIGDFDNAVQNKMKLSLE